MQFQWSQIKELLEEVQTKSSVTLEFPTKRIAKLFTYSVYNYRRKKNLQDNFSLVSISEPDPETQETKHYVTIYKPVEILIRKVPSPTLITSN